MIYFFNLYRVHGQPNTPEWSYIQDNVRVLNEITFTYAILFNYLERARNIAGLILEQLGRKRREQLIISTQHRDFAR
ncbi:MAG: hypothetical protein ACJ71O_14790 [Nitrososphaeraceae archaeon]